MSCCGKAKAVLDQGKSIVVGYARQGKSIAVGYARHAAGVKYEWTDDRIRTCWDCEMQTWMTGNEYAAWLLQHGIAVITNFTELEKLPLLPKYEQDSKRRQLYCRLCKCFIPAKARVADKNCPLKKW
ncbi:MAG TPA: hypothetical protein VMW23_10020 [Sedimentisphaerales bacterium]|nr:hypothetical protein [Sedimentisphaerales bacterium]